MISVSLFLFIYLLGGVTFPALIAWALFRVAPNERDPRGQGRARARLREAELMVRDIREDFKAGDFEEQQGVDVQKRGLVTMTTKYHYHHSEIAALQEPDEDLPTRDQLKKRHNFYGVIKHGNLFLYKDEATDSGLCHVIVLKETFVTLWPRNSHRESPEGSLFTKEKCIAIFKAAKVNLDENNDLTFDTGRPDGTSGVASHLDEFFLYIPNNVEKEDWYFALVRASKVSAPRSGINCLLDPNVSAQTEHINTRDMLALIQTLNSTEAQLGAKWLNALIGRLFIGLQQTESLSNLLRVRLAKKLAKINKPGFLDDFTIESVDVGNAAPFITQPHLKDIAASGLLKIGFNILYQGGMSLIVSTKANINLSSRFKTREVRVQLSVTVRRISGPVVVLVKPPPSDRIWYAFETEPVLDLDVEPVLSTKQISYNVVTNAIKSKFREAIRESLVLPFMDDIPFYETADEFYRGGIWKHSKAGNDTKKSPENLRDLNYETNNSLGVQDLENQSSSSKYDLVDDIQSQESSDAASATHESLSNDRLLKTESGESTIKERTLKKVDTLKSMLKPRGDHSDGENSLNSTEHQAASNSNAPTKLGEIIKEDAVSSKKYLNAGIKKFGKWYKDTLSSPEQSDTSNIESVSQPVLPEMISNRRTVLKKKGREPEKGELTAERRSSSAAEMFANKTKTNSTPPSSNNEASFHPYANNAVNLGPTSPNFQSHTKNRKTSGTFTESIDQPQGLGISSCGNEVMKQGEARLEQSIDRPAREAPMTLQELNKRRPVPPIPLTTNEATKSNSESIEND
ncbi:LAMI_0D09648g1_1 [Lachancea mirantina]|uniref:LAMI_0D09648g1_1 n=1 Tax=Lachancea mirantina TaxID=1230905 RepID=A0A1G4JDP0_9SACH|nr:LAMI_0D09648g1_1 [Lachancea mirantina]